MWAKLYIHTKDNNYSDNNNYEVLIIVFILWKHWSPHHNYNDNDTAEWSRWITVRTIFFQLINARNIDSQSESILL